MKSNTQNHKIDQSNQKVTPETLFNQRRSLLKSTLAGGALMTASVLLPNFVWASLSKQSLLKFNNTKKTYSVDEPLNSFKDITTYNNFYELGTSKDDPVRFADKLITNDWKVSIEGECKKTGSYSLEELLAPHSFEERVYRFRCVEAWSMVIPWVGFPLADLIKRFEPTKKAKYVYFETIYDKKNPLPGQKRPTVPWPYREGLRMDEAMHPLTFMATGLYGKPLPNQNGAPIRLVVPWKYGFKSIKSIVKIRFTEEEPQTSWNMIAPREYGFYSNVNPEVNHPRWSQKRERRIGELFKRKTLMFNGYADEVAHLYKGMDLKKFY